MNDNLLVSLNILITKMPYYQLQSTIQGTEKVRNRKAVLHYPLVEGISCSRVKQENMYFEFEFVFRMRNEK